MVDVLGPPPPPDTPAPAAATDAATAAAACGGLCNGAGTKGDPAAPALNLHAAASHVVFACLAASSARVLRLECMSASAAKAGAVNWPLK